MKFRRELKLRDIHTHILYDIDDGAEDIFESVELCRIAFENNVTDIILTPHVFRFNNVDDLLKERDEKIAILSEKIKNEGIDIKLYPGAEVFADEDILFADCLEKLTLNNSRYLLMEFEFRNLSVNRALKYMNTVKQCGLVPIIAHPERYDFIQQKYENLNMFMDEGALFQVNASSLAGYGNKAEKKLSEAIVLGGFADFIASDAHSVKYRPSDLLETIKDAGLNVSRGYLDIVLEQNTASVINNEEIIPYNRVNYFTRRTRFNF